MILMGDWDISCDGCGLSEMGLDAEAAAKLILEHKCPHFEDGQRVKFKKDPKHVGKVLHQTDDRVLWVCEYCNVPGDDLSSSLEPA